MGVLPGSHDVRKTRYPPFSRTLDSEWAGHVCDGKLFSGDGVALCDDRDPELDRSGPVDPSPPVERVIHPSAQDQCERGAADGRLSFFPRVELGIVDEGEDKTE